MSYVTDSITIDVVMPQDFYNSWKRERSGQRYGMLLHHCSIRTHMYRHLEKSTSYAYRFTDQTLCLTCSLIKRTDTKSETAMQYNEIWDQDAIW